MRGPRTRYVLSVLAAVLLSLTAARPAQADDKAYHKALRSTAWVLVPHGNAADNGTCCVVSRELRLVMTNKHVVGDKTEVLVFFPIYHNGKVVFDSAAYLDARHMVKGRVVARDEKRDLALIQVDAMPPHVEAMTLAPGAVEKGEPIYSIGNSDVTVKGIDSARLWTLRTGTVQERRHWTNTLKNTGDRLSATMIRTTSRIRSGDSGGPMVDSEGRLVAVTSSYTDTESYGICVTEVRGFLLEQLPSVGR